VPTVAEERRRELAEFLRSRRARRSPADVGLPPGGRRRTPGLRREEVAAVAGLSVTWYTWLEQAREVRASRQVLGSLVDVLGLDAVETAHLFRLAGELPPSPDAAVAADELPAQYELLLANLDPNPAFVANHRFDVLAWNRGCAALWTDLPDVPPARRNVLWMTFMSGAMRATLVDWETEAAQTVALFRAQVGDGVLAPDIQELVAALSRVSEEFRRLWGRRDLVGFAPQGRAMRHPALGLVELEHVKLHSGDRERTTVALLAEPGSVLAGELARVAATARSSAEARSGAGARS
jgi:hypothetical protein